MRGRKKSNNSIKILTLALLLISGFFAFININNKSNAKDVSSNLTITDMHAYLDEAEQRELTEGVNAITKSSDWFKVRLVYHYESDTAIASGDTVKIPFAQERRAEGSTYSFEVPNIANTDLLDSSNNKIGTWNLNNYYLTIKFSDNAVGKTSIDGSIGTTLNIRVNEWLPEHAVLPFTVGGFQIGIPKDASPMSHPGPEAAGGLSQASNNRAKWMILTPLAAIDELYFSEGNGPISAKNHYNDLTIESALGEGAKPSSVQLFAAAYIPLNLTDGSKGTSGININFDGSKLFTRKDSNSDVMSYDAWKASMKAQEYGFFLNKTTNRYNFFVNLGNIPNDNIKLTDLVKLASGTEMAPGDYARVHSYPRLTDEIVAEINKLNGDSNSVGGKVMNWRIYFAEEYPSVTVKTPISNTSTVSYIDGNGETVPKNVTSAGSLVVGDSEAVLKGTAKILVRDRASFAPISDVDISLQKLENGSTWTTVSDGSKTTGDDGIVQVNNLTDGTYRWVATRVPGHYIVSSFTAYSDMDHKNLAEKIVMSDTNGFMTYATLEKEQYTVRFVGGEHGIFRDIEKKFYYGDTLIVPNASQILGDDGWVFTGWTPEIESIVTRDRTYTAQWDKLSVTLTTNFFIVDTETPVADQKVKTVYIGDDYYAAPAESLYDEYADYELVTVEEGYGSGRVGSENITVNYYYKAPTTPDVPSSPKTQDDIAGFVATFAVSAGVLAVIGIAVVLRKKK